MVDGESVMRMRERGDGADLDILVVGEVRDIMRFVGERIVCGVTRCEQP